MALSVFDDRAHAPTPDDLKRVLSRASRLWTKLIGVVQNAVPHMTDLWTFTSAKYGWSLRLKDKDRVIVYLTPRERGFLVGVVLGEKAIAAARARGLSDAALALIADAPKYAEGYGIRLEVTNAAQLAPAIELVEIKLAGS